MGHLFSDNPWYFTRPDAPCDYTFFREKIGQVFGISEESVMLIGSGYFGRSLSPSSPFRPYRLRNTSGNPKSDLDVVIISPKHFETIWIDLIAAFYAGHHYVYKRYAKSTFKKFVSFDSKMHISNLGASRVTTKFDRILRLYDDVKREANTSLRLKNEIKFRVYRNKDDVLAYQNWSISEFKKAIA
ncbi:hypothetical protein [Hellea balneolensis]|uniref:hypothetical protein n=1 Tax=Hellea balneolensis TaxID=287478 RepID=UPI000402652D|nr:hypothetical protein [Hellea balneolensis]